MKSMTKILAMILVCIMAFSSVSLAADAQTTNENEPTATTVAETTKEAEKETTTLPADEATTVPEAEATTSDSESTAPTEDETTTVLPEETTKREIKLPNAPTNLYCDSYSQEGHCVVNWDVVPEAVDGYDVFLKADDQWVYKTTVIHYTYADLKDLLCGQKYEIGVRSFILVDGEKYYSEDIATCVGGPGDDFPYITLRAQAYFGGVNIKWTPLSCVSGYLLYIRQNNKWVRIATISDPTTGEYDYKSTNIKSGTKYTFAIKAYTKGNAGTKYGKVLTCSFDSGSIDKVKVIKGSESASAVTLKWEPLNGAKGYRVFKYDAKNKKYVAIKTTTALEYKVTGIYDSQKYYFKVRPYYKADGKTYWGSYSDTLKIDSVGKTKLTKSKLTNSAVTLKWKAVEGAKGYRLYKYDPTNKKYVAVKTTSALTYTVTGLNASTSYTFRLRAYYKVDGQTKWCTLSDKFTVVTAKKAVTAKYVDKYKKYFADGAWSMKLGPIRDDSGNYFNITIALKGDTLCAVYDYKSNKIDDFKYLIQLNSGKAYLIIDKTKTYYLLSTEDAYYITLTIASLAAVLDMSEAKNVTAETAYVSNKTCVIETYTDKEVGITKRYTFYNGKMTCVEIIYPDESNETFDVISVVDAPAASMFKLPSNYKKDTY